MDMAICFAFRTKCLLLSLYSLFRFYGIYL